MDYIDLHSTDLDNVTSSIGTETPGNNDQNGGFFWSSNNDSDQKAILAAKRGKYEAVEFMLDEGMVTDFMAKDANGATILHYLIPNAGNPVAARLIDRIIKDPRARKVVNAQNHAGCTPLHLAVEMENNELADRLVAYGADMSIKDKKGRSVEKQVETDDFSSGVDKSHILLGVMPKLVQAIRTYEPDETETVVIPLENVPSVTAPRVVNIEHARPQPDSPSTEDFLNRLWNRYNTAGMTGGGAKHVRVGHRKLRTYVQGANQNPSELRNLVSSQASAIHDRVIEAIMELRNVDREKAKIIKAAIYAEVKKERPELTNLDRAIEMQKRVTNEYIDTLDLEATQKAMQKHYEEKKKRQENEDKGDKKEKKTKKEKKATKKGKEDTASDEFSTTSESA